MRATRRLLTISHNATLKAGKYWGNAGQQYLTGHRLSPSTPLLCRTDRRTTDSRSRLAVAERWSLKNGQRGEPGVAEVDSRVASRSEVEKSMSFRAR